MDFYKSKAFLFLSQSLIISYVLVFGYTLDEYISFDKFEATFSTLTFSEGFNFLIFVSFIISILINTIRLVLKLLHKSNLFLIQFLYDVFISLSVISIIYALFSIEYFSRLYLLILAIFIPIILKIIEVVYQKSIFIFSVILFILFITPFIYEIPETNPTTKEIIGSISRQEHVELEYPKIVEMYKTTEARYQHSGFLGNSKLNIDKFVICCKSFSYDINGLKSAGYFDIHKNNLIYVSGNGVINFVDLNVFLTKENFLFEVINSNIFQQIKNVQVFDSKIESGYDNDSKDYWESIKDVVLHNEKIFISYVEEIEDNCVGVNILTAKLNYDFLEFEQFFSTDECIQRSIETYNALQSGGKMLIIDNNIILSIGDFRDYTRPQNDNSLFGKIIQIDIETGNSSILSKGHRNPQGLESSFDKTFIISTEHGPKGGDEINIISLDNKNQNFGWPISSYGDHYKPSYNTDYKDTAPLNKSHKNFGFEEPIIYFPFAAVGSHGISDVIVDYFSINEDGQNSFFVSTLKGKVLYRFTIKDNEIIDFNTFKNSERIRDIQYSKQLNGYLFLYEDTPSIGFLSER